MKNNELLNAIDFLEKEKSIPREVLIETIEAALITAYKKNYNSASNVRVELNMDNGSYAVYSRKDVVEEVENPREQVSLERALETNPAYEVGDIFEENVTPSDFGRVSAQAAKQAVMQRLRDAERGILYNEFIDKEDDIMTGSSTVSIIVMSMSRWVRQKLCYQKQNVARMMSIVRLNASRSMSIKWNRRRKDRRFSSQEVIRAC